MDTYVIKFPFMDADTQDGKLTPNYLKSEITGEYGYAPNMFFALTNDIKEADKFYLCELNNRDDLKGLKQFAKKVE